MFRYLTFASIVLFFIVPVAHGQSSQILFTVAGQPVEAGEFMYLYKKNSQNKSATGSVTTTDEYLTLFTNFKLKIAEARARGLDTTRKFQQEFKTYRDELKRPYRAEADVLSKLTQEAYDRLKEEIRASHIIAFVKPDAAPDDTLKAYNKLVDLKKRIDAGENFQKLAQEFSEEPSAKYNNGDLGYFTALQMVYSFEQAAYALSVGQVSPIIRTRFGYHLIQATDRRPARGEVEVSHILVRKESPTDDKAKSKIFQVYDEWRAGKTWDDLCKEYSDDGSTKNSGGRLRPFGAGALPTIPEFETSAFALEKPGDVSDPFQSSVGWHIIRLEKKIPLAPFKDMESSLRRTISKNERVQLSEKKLEEKRKREFQFKEDELIKSVVFSHADSTLTAGNFRYRGPADILPKELFRLADQSITAGDFVSFCKKEKAQSAADPKSYMAELYRQLINDKLSDVEDEQLKKANPDFKYLLNEYREGILLFEIMEKEVWNKASEDTVGQRLFYNTNLSRYKAGDRVEAQVMATSDKAFLTTMKARLTGGDSLRKEDIRKFKSVQNFRYYEKGESKIIDRVSWQVGTHEAELEGNYYLVVIRKLIPPGVKRFEEARPSVIADFQEELEKKWVATLAAKYPVKINKKVKKFVQVELTRK